jgi:hypothetical protein
VQAEWIASAIKDIKEYPEIRSYPQRKKGKDWCKRMKGEVG